jgi:hypothetical protein
MAVTNLTADAARERFSYDPASGRLWQRPSPRIKAKFCETRNSDGYVVVKFARRQFMAHRVIWLMVHGKWPVGCIDHINGVRDDNRLENLRDADALINAQNKLPRPTGSRPATGVRKHGRKFAVYLGYAGRLNYVGLYPTIEEAVQQYQQEKRLAMERSLGGNTLRTGGE